MATTSAAASSADKTTQPELPKLSRQEFQIYNRCADRMEIFHNHFRHSWGMLYKACTDRKRPAGMTIRQFLDEGLHFARALGMHHSIEEAHVFPILAKRMPEFQAPNKRDKNNSNNSKAAELVMQHRAIHVGMDAFQEYLQKCRNGETELDLNALKAQMDTWGDVLWQHLDEEVKTLGAENMRKFWTLEEIQRIPM